MVVSSLAHHDFVAPPPLSLRDISPLPVGEGECVVVSSLAHPFVPCKGTMSQPGVKRVARNPGIWRFSFISPNFLPALRAGKKLGKRGGMPLIPR